MTEDNMTDDHESSLADEHEGALADELADSLRAAAALTPRSADPYGPLGPAIARDRRRRATLGASLAVVAVLGAAVGIGSAVGRGGSAGPASAAAAGSTTTSPFAPPTNPATNPATDPVTHSAPAAPPTTASTTTSTPPPLTFTTSQAMMFGWPTDYSLFPGYQTSTAQAKPAVDAMIHAYGKPVSDGTRDVLDNLVGSFKLCGYPLSSYTFKLQWAGDLAHAGGDGAVVVDVSHGGAVYRMFGSGSYKGVWLQLPETVDASEAAHVEAAPLAELDSPAQVFYAVVVAAPGSKVTVAGTKTNAKVYGSPVPFQADPVTVGASGLVEVKLTTRDAANGFLAYPDITSVTIVRPDGTTASAPLLGGTSDAQEQAARELLPATTTCPGMTPEKLQH
ncbi:hypothetical protein ABH926_002697 [Catenulispora sp. GP43]|uniref:hypothetical protein n=1 Tax=Catenulispora sp. GP43 TaxID=3156263 RepID=UPI003512934F